MKEITYRTKAFFDDLADQKEKHIHLILIATKPDIIKQVPLYNELKKRGHVAVLGHTGQHYDENLSGGMLKEFGVEPDFNLNVRGEMYEVVSQIIGRLGYVIGELKSAEKSLFRIFMATRRRPWRAGSRATATCSLRFMWRRGYVLLHPTTKPIR